MRYKIDFASMEWNTHAAGVRMKVHKEGGRQVRLVEFTKDFVETDWCTRGHAGYLLEGSMEINFGGFVEAFKPGDGVFIPSGPEHKHIARVLTEKAVLILIEEIGESPCPADSAADA